MPISGAVGAEAGQAPILEDAEAVSAPEDRQGTGVQRDSSASASEPEVMGAPRAGRRLVLRGRPDADFSLQGQFGGPRGGAPGPGGTPAV